MTEIELIKFLDDKLCEIAEVMMSYYDCCGIRGSSCKGGDPNPCCTGRTMFGNGCPFQKADGGCGNRNCACKLWICKTAIDTTDPKCVEGLKILEKFAELYGLTRPPLIGRPYSGADKQAKSNQ